VISTLEMGLDETDMVDLMMELREKTMNILLS